MKTKDPIITPEESSTSEHQVRLEKLKALEAAHINPWPAPEKVTAESAMVKSEFDDSSTELGKNEWG